ncbi:hypothetical protein PLICRDRAFT_362547 [Plicaturopsis crispa FD-325 SS-3]|uniref:Unplaced genomic scaffold PLICRscaffold_18, whole genome shotgun sequence n=1 Tax=Plicaturopsis crispa FD-325 SS-3 TaxID=944288 RepID=A0A0C9SXG1_PLICR|nr:hypothetical protein PLICRDRAFT_362547 [Plicaturopsis crispa FD-325 SS-3]
MDAFNTITAFFTSSEPTAASAPTDEAAASGQSSFFAVARSENLDVPADEESGNDGNSYCTIA